MNLNNWMRWFIKNIKSSDRCHKLEPDFYWHLSDYYWSSINGQTFLHPPKFKHSMMDIASFTSITSKYTLHTQHKHNNSTHRPLLNELEIKLLVNQSRRCCCMYLSPPSKFQHLTIYNQIFFPQAFYFLKQSINQSVNDELSLAWPKSRVSYLTVQLL
jgi:hypothetical protein